MNAGNPWGIQIRRVFDMAKAEVVGACLRRPSEDFLPMHEAKMIHQFDHRWASYRVEDGKDTSNDVALEDKQNPDFCVTPRYWVDKSEVEQRVFDKGWDRGWLMGWRDITNATNERTVIASILPYGGTDFTIRVNIGIGDSSLPYPCLLANLNSLALDFVARQKIGGTHLADFIIKQIPILPPDFYTESDLSFIVPRVLELTYTAHELQPWAQDLGYDGAPFTFDPDRRARIRAELDAWYSRAYGLTRDELRYILDPKEVMGDDYPSETFRVLKNNDLKTFGEYRTGKWVLHEFDRMALAEKAKEPYVSLLVPPPGQKPSASYSPHGVICDEVDARLAGLMLSMIKASSSLPRKQLDLALTVAQMSDSASSQLDSEVTNVLDNYRNMGVFDAERVARSQTLLRYFEDAGVIRFEQKGAWITALPTAVIPDGIIFEPNMKEIALALLGVAQTRLREPSSLADEDADTQVKRA